MSIKVGIIGAAGFAGAELVRLLGQHPDFDVVAVTSDALQGMPLEEAARSFVGCSALAFSAHDDDILLECDAVFLAVPHTAAMEQAPRLLEAGVDVFDLSADYRLKDASLYERWYGVTHTSPHLLARATFGLPELFPDEIRAAQNVHEQGEPVLVACAGCYPTATSLAAYPAVRALGIEGPLVVDAISGVTGAGKKLTERTHFCFANENLEAYGVANHRHIPEMEQILGLEDRIVFTPHLAPLNRGLLSTVYMKMMPQALDGGLASVWDVYDDFYRDSGFVEVLPLGSLPQTAAVTATNRALIGLALHEQTSTLVAVCAIDNLYKGAAGQAVQCANLIYGLPEAQGLEFCAVLV